MTNLICEETLKIYLQELLGDDQTQLSALIADLSVAIELESGQTLFSQGDAGDCMYFVMRGRLAAALKSGSKPPKIVMEVGRHEMIGEIALFTQQARTATVFALRDSLVLQISQQHFEKISKISPLFALHISKAVIERLSRSMLDLPPPKTKANVLTIINTYSGLQDHGFSHSLYSELTNHGAAICVNKSDFTKFTGHDLHSEEDTSNAFQQFANWIDELELNYRFILLRVDDPDSLWATRCIGLGDRILLLADHNSSERDNDHLTTLTNRSYTHSELIILHDNKGDKQLTAQHLLKHRNVHTHHNIYAKNKDDIAKLARFYAGKAIGLVLAGGGAKGFAHIGVLRALREANIPLDSVGGTSIGSVVAALIAMNRSTNEITDIIRKGFIQDKPLNDYTLPSVSLLRGFKLNQLLQRYCGKHQQIEDLWLSYFCVSANLTSNKTIIHNEGVLWQAIRASISLPGMLPPVVLDKQLLVDGGLVNNLPVDVMATTDVGKIIAVDLQGGSRQFLASDTSTSDDLVLKKSNWFQRGKKDDPNKDPRLFDIMMRASLIASTQQTTKNIAGADIYINPPMEKIGLLEFNAFERIVEAGYSYTCKLLEENDSLF